MSASVHAEMYVEPSVGYGMGTVNVAKSTFAGAESMSAPSLGARLGVFFDYVFVGADLKASYLSLQGDKSNLMTTLGLGMAFTMDYVPLRFFGSLDLANNMRAQNTNLTSFGYRVGVGYYITENILVNLEMQSAKFSALDSGSTTTASFQGYFATVSFPFTFGYPSTPWRERYRTRQGPSSSGSQLGTEPSHDGDDELMDDSLE